MIWIGVAIIIGSFIIADGFTVLGHIIARAIKEAQQGKEGKND